MSEAIDIPALTDADVIFGSCRAVLPKYSDLPEEFRREQSPFCRIAEALFFKGGRLSDHGLTAKPGVDENRAIRVIKCCLGSFEPKHEHKIAGVGYLLSQWYDRATGKD